MIKLHRFPLISMMLIVIIVVSNNTSSNSLYTGSIELQDSQIKRLIYEYFSTRCDMYMSNKPAIDFSSVVDYQDGRTIEWLKLEQEIHEIQQIIRTYYPNNILDCSFSLDIQSTQFIDDDLAVVKLSEDYEIIYEHRPDKPSVVANIQHEIWLKKIVNGWLILEDQYSDDFTRVLNTLSKNAIIDNIQKNLEPDREGVEREESNYSLPITQNSNNMKLFNYKNSSAVIYADNYYDMDETDGPVPSAIIELDGWDTSWDTTYKEYLSDCTNFVSQAILEGVSYTASDPNHFYPDPSNIEEWWYYKFSIVADGSMPWISVGDLYEFLTENYFNYETFGIDFVIRGPAGKVVNLCNIDIGDVILMYENDVNPGWAHAVIVDDLDPNHCYGTNVYVAAHSDDAKQRPLSDYSGYLWYPVEIKGYFSNAHIVFLPFVYRNLATTAEILTNPYPPPSDLIQQPMQTQIPYPLP